MQPHAQTFDALFWRLRSKLVQWHGSSYNSNVRDLFGCPAPP